MQIDWSIPLRERPPLFTARFGEVTDKQRMIEVAEAKSYLVTPSAKVLIANDHFRPQIEVCEYQFVPAQICAPVWSKECLDLWAWDDKDNPMPKVTSELYNRVYELGFVDAPFEAALLLAAEFQDWELNRGWTVLSPPLETSYAGVLSIGHLTSQIYIDGTYAGPRGYWFGRQRLLLCRKVELKQRRIY